jgi:putative sigma-54 modulation protein
MQISFTGHGLDVTPAINRITSVHVVFDVEKLTQIAEATILVTKGEVHARSESEDLYSAIDLLVDKLDRQLLKHKEKMLDHRDHRDHRDENLDKL